MNPVGRWLARFLSRPLAGSAKVATCSPELLAQTLRKGDILLVEGNTRFSVAIKYMTQSTWSHATLYIADALDPSSEGEKSRVLLEADIIAGVRAVPLSQYSGLHTRICRPVGLEPKEIDALVSFAVSHIGQAYDLNHVLDLARYLLPTPPVPVRWRRPMIALGSGDPTRAICSSLIAQAFHSVRYPILPNVTDVPPEDPDGAHCHKEILHIRDLGLFMPRDFDVSPYFRIVKPRIDEGFDPHRINWSPDSPAG